MKKMSLFKTLLLFVIFIFSLIYCSNDEEGKQKKYSGNFYVNDSGRSHGGFEYTQGYEATMTVTDNKGELKITYPRSGLGDKLDRHNFKITDFEGTDEYLKFKIDNRNIKMVYVEEDNIWNGDYNNYYFANRTTEESEALGTLHYEVFYGLKSTYYLELRLKQDNSESNSNLLK